MEFAPYKINIQRLILPLDKGDPFSLLLIMHR